MFEWTGFAKFWLWFCFVVNIIMVVIYVLGIFGSFLVGGTLLMVLCTIAEICLIIGLAILLFKKQKLGFYIVAGTAVLNIVLNAMSGQLIRGIISAVVSLVILFFAIKPRWNEMP